nr:hypothetical protein [Microbispora rosea]
MLAIMASLSLQGALASPTPTAPKPTPTVPSHFTLLLPINTKNNDIKAIENAAVKLVENAAGRRLIKIDRQANINRSAPILGTVGNVSVEWFDLSWLKQAGDIPSWLRPKNLLKVLKRAKITIYNHPAKWGRFETSTRVLKLERDRELLEEIGAEEGGPVLEIATTSMKWEKHSEVIPLEWLRLIIQTIAEKKNMDPDAAEHLSEKFIQKSSLYLATQRTPCLDKCHEATSAFRRVLAIAYYGENSSEHQKEAKLLVPQVMQRADAKLRRRETAESLRQHMRRLGCEAPASPASALGAPAGHRHTQVLAMAAAAPSAPCTASDTGGLARALSAEDYGGVDFSTLELRYLADRPDSGEIQYSFSARPARPGFRQTPESVLQTATDATADLRTWLVLNPSTFWVNLHPRQPDRIIDQALGQTNAGRAMLEADLQMKRTEGELLNPNTKLGKKYWKRVLGSGSAEKCFSTRMWIVPGRVQVYEEADSLFVLDAPLAVKLKAEDIGGSYSCGSPDPAETARIEKLQRTMVLPEIVKRINTAPEYAPLRRAFTARVVAQWIRERHREGRRTSFDQLIDSGDLGSAKLADDWSPRQVFDAYVRSLKEGEFSVKQTIRQGNTTVIHRFVFGGVDFSSVRMTPVGAAEMEQRHPHLPRVVQASMERPQAGADGLTWLGETGHLPAPGMWTRITDGIADITKGRVGVLALVLAALGAIVFGFRGGSARKRHRAS